MFEYIYPVLHVDIPGCDQNFLIKCVYVCVHMCVLGMLFADCDCGSSHGMIDLNLVHAVIFSIVSFCCCDFCF